MVTFREWHLIKGAASRFNSSHFMTAYEAHVLRAELMERYRRAPQKLLPRKVVPQQIPAVRKF